MGFFPIQELTCLQMTCQKLRYEGEDKEGWLSLLWDKDTPVTRLLLAELTPSSAAGALPGKTARASSSSSPLDT